MALLLMFGLLMLAPACGASDEANHPESSPPTPDAADCYTDSGDGVAPDEVWPPECDDVAYRCADYATINPVPYDSCSGLPFYRICPELRCVPIAGELKVFYDAWRAVAPQLLGMTQEVFSSHVILSRLSLASDFPTEREYRADFLLVLDWVIIRQSHQARVPSTSTVDKDLLANALLSVPSNRFSSLPEKVVPLSEVQAFFSNLELIADYCHVFLSRPPQGPGLRIAGGRDDASSGQCLFANFDLVQGIGDCSLWAQ